MCFTPRCMSAIKFHSSPKQVEVLASSLYFCHQKVTICISDMVQRSTARKKQTLNMDGTVIPFLTNQALVFMDTNGFLGTKNNYLESNRMQERKYSVKMESRHENRETWTVISKFSYLPHIHRYFEENSVVDIIGTYNSV